MLNEKRAGMPIPKQRPMPRIVAGTDLMAALQAEHREGQGGNAKGGRQASGAGGGAHAAAKPPAAAESKRTPKGSPDQREMLLPIAGGAKEAGGTAKEGPEKQTAQSPDVRKKAG